MRSRSSLKIILSMVLIAVLISGFAFSAGAGYFEGFQIVNVKVNGKTVNGDVPAVILNGRTMVPAKFVSEALGADVAWDPVSFTASITQSGIKENVIDNNTEKLKVHVDIMDLHNQMLEYSYGMSVMQVSIPFSATSIDDGEVFSEFMIELNETMQAFKTVKSSIDQEAQNIVNKAKLHNIDISNTIGALNDYNECTELTEKVIETLFRYYSYREPADANQFLNEYELLSQKLEGTNKRLETEYNSNYAIIKAF